MRPPISFPNCLQSVDLRRGSKGSPHNAFQLEERPLGLEPAGRQQGHHRQPGLGLSAPFRGGLVGEGERGSFVLVQGPGGGPVDPGDLHRPRSVDCLLGPGLLFVHPKCHVLTLHPSSTFLPLFVPAGVWDYAVLFAHRATAHGCAAKGLQVCPRSLDQKLLQITERHFLPRLCQYLSEGGPIISADRQLP